MTVHELLRNQFYSSNIITEEIMLGSVFEEDTTVWKGQEKKKQEICLKKSNNSLEATHNGDQVSPSPPSSNEASFHFYFVRLKQ